jgi:hypothetical protein
MEVEPASESKSLAHETQTSEILYIAYVYPDANKRGPMESASKLPRKMLSISSAQLASALTEFVERFGTAIEEAGRLAGQYALDEIKVNVEIGLKGEITLLGNSVTGTGGSGLELKFKRIAA